jgi:hypothetical protein
MIAFGFALTNFFTFRMTSGGGAAPTFPDNTTGASEYLIIF